MTRRFGSVTPSGPRHVLSPTPGSLVARCCGARAPYVPRPDAGWCGGCVRYARRRHDEILRQELAYGITVDPKLAARLARAQEPAR